MNPLHLEVYEMGQGFDQTAQFGARINYLDDKSQTVRVPYTSAYQVQN